MQPIWPCFQPSSVHYCSSESQTSTLRLVSKTHSCGGGVGVQTHRQANVKCIYLHAHTHTYTQKHILCTSHTLTPAYIFSTFLLFASVSLTHTTLLAGIRSFYRVAVCWRGRQHGHTPSPSSDWISDQYPVPHRPASSGQTDCL